MELIQQFTIDESTQSVILNNNVCCKYNLNTLEFVIDNEPYVLFQFPTTLRQHKTISDYTDEMFYHYGIMPCRTADIFLELVAGLCCPHISLSAIPEENRKSFLDLLECIKNLSVNDSTLKKPYEALDRLIRQIPSDLYSDFLNFRKQTRTILLSVPETETRSATMTIVCDFLVKYASYDKSLLEVHSTTVTPYLIYSTLMIYCITNSIFHVDFPLDIIAVTSHLIMCMLIDILTDRWSTELIIKNGNTSLRAIYQDLKHKYQALNLPLTKWTTAMVDKIKIDLNENCSIGFYPYVLWYHISEKERFNKILTTYKDIIKNNQLGFDSLALYNAFNVDQLTNQCNEIVLPLTKEKSLYTTDSLLKLLDTPIFHILGKQIENGES